MRYFIYIFTISLLTIASCKKTKVQEETGEIRVINASFIAKGINIDVDYKPVYNKYIEYVNFSLFTKLIASRHPLRIYDSLGTFSVDTAITIVKDKNYSLFVYDSMNTIQYKFVEEDFSPFTGSYCKIRYMNLSNDAPRVDFVDIKNGVKRAENIGNGEYTNYLLTLSDTTSIRTQLASSFPIIHTQGITAYEPGNFYTLILKGNVSSTSVDSIGLYVLKNNMEY